MQIIIKGRCFNLAMVALKLHLINLLIVLFAQSVSAQSSLSEYKVKAVFLFNFSKFVKWPPETFANESNPLVIGILGKDPFGNILEETMKGEKVNNRPLVIKRFRNADDISLCHILFITDLSKAADVQASKFNILTVGESENFAQRGGMIGFLKENHKTKIQINLNAVKGANLSIDSRLLRLAEIVDTRID